MDIALIFESTILSYGALNGIGAFMEALNESGEKLWGICFDAEQVPLKTTIKRVIPLNNFLVTIGNTSSYLGSESQGRVDIFVVVLDSQGQPIGDIPFEATDCTI